MKRSAYRFAQLASLGALFSAATLSRPALAFDTELGVDLDFVHPISEGGVNSGGGGALRLGKQLDLIALSLTGEIGASYHSFGGTVSPDLFSGIAGGRLSIGKLIEPGLLFHVGGGHLTGNGVSTWVPLFDVGAFLELTLLPLLDIGVHATYVHCFSNSDIDTFEYWLVGPHAALIF
jgi:hypothetical protein